MATLQIKTVEDILTIENKIRDKELTYGALKNTIVTFINDNGPKELLGYYDEPYHKYALCLRVLFELQKVSYTTKIISKNDFDVLMPMVKKAIEMDCQYAKILWIYFAEQYIYGLSEFIGPLTHEKTYFDQLLLYVFDFKRFNMFSDGNYDEVSHLLSHKLMFNTIISEKEKNSLLEEKYKEQTKELLQVKQKLEALENHLQYQPGSVEYFNIEKDFADKSNKTLIL